MSGPLICFALWYRQVPEHEAQENEILYHVSLDHTHDIQFHSLGPHILGLVDTKVQIKYKGPGHGPLGTSGTLQVWTSWEPWDAT